MNATIMVHPEAGRGEARIVILPDSPRYDGSPLMYLDIQPTGDNMGAGLSVFLDREMVRSLRVAFEEAEQRLDDLGVVLAEPVL